MKSFCVMCVSSDHRTNDCQKLKAQKVASPVVLQTLKEEIGSVTEPKCSVTSSVTTPNGSVTSSVTEPKKRSVTRQELWKQKKGEEWKESRKEYMREWRKRSLGEKLSQPLETCAGIS